MAVCESLLLKLEYISRAQMHSAYFYTVAVFGTLGIVVALGVASRHRWGCTILTGVYTTFGLAFLWILPLFPAEPKLGPVYNPVTHFIPWEFPLLVMVPALVTDLILQRTVAGVRCSGRSPRAWPFSPRSSRCSGRSRNFLMSPLARNWFFGTAYMDFSTPPTSLYARFEFVPPETLLQLGRGLLIAVVTSCVMTYAGLHAGRAMQRVNR